MSAIQNAYQGFAKQNYTMLDNLKLGYGGTKTEMERLLKDAQKLTGVKYDINNLSDVYQAIHVIQQEIGITGTTALEAEETISGSISSLKASWDNFLNGSGDLGKVLESAMTVLKNISKAVQKLIPDILENVSEWLPEIIELGAEIIGTLSDSIIENLPVMISCAIEMIDKIVEGLISALPRLIPAAISLISQIIQALLKELPKLVECGIKIIIELAKGIIQELPNLLKQLPTVIKQIVDTLIDNLPLLLEVTLELILMLIKGIAEYLPVMLNYAPTVIEKLMKTLIDSLPTLIPVAAQIIVTLIQALIENLPKLVTFTPKIIWTIIKTLIQNLPQLFSTGAQLTWEVIKGLGNKLWEVGNKAWEIGETVRKKIKEFIDKAFGWGKDMIQGFMNGMSSKKPAVKTVTTGVVGAIKSLMHFSRPDEGPLRDYETWMPDMVMGLAKTLKQASPILEKEAQALASKLQMAVNMQQAQFALQTNVSRGINVDVNVTGGDMYFDTERVGQVLAPSVSNAIRTGGAN